MTGETPRSASQDRPVAVLVDHDGLGDALIRLPFLRAVRRAWPDRPVWWIAAQETAMAHDLAPWVGGLIDRTVEHAGLTEPLWSVASRLRALPPFDLVFDTRTRLAPVLLARLLLSCRAFHPSLPQRLLATGRMPAQGDAAPGSTARLLSQVAAASGAPADWRGDFEIGSAATHLATWRLRDGPSYVGLAAGSRETGRNWPLASFVALAQRLERAGRVPVFLVGPQTRDVLDVLRAGVPSGLFPEADPIDPEFKLRPLELLMAIGRRLAAVVANDSGIGHLLGLGGTPVVSLFGPTDADRRRPFTQRGAVVRAQDFGGATMDAIPVEPVFAAVEAIIADQSDRPAPPR
jgi:ADP-heptose:LPS heptosyltransferase